MKAKELTEKLKELIKKKYNIINANEPLSKVIPMLEKWEEKNAILVEEEGEIIGVLRERDLIRGCAMVNPHEAKIKSFAVRTGILKINEITPEKIARRFIEDSTPFVVIKLNKKHGVIHVDDFLRLLKTEFESVKIKKIMNPEVITVNDHETTAKALALMRNYGIDRLVVVDENNKVVGIITGKDIIDRILSPRKKAKFGELYGEKEKAPSIVVKSIMSQPVITIEKNDSAANAIEVMIKYNISSLVVVDRKGHPEGILIKKDIIESFVKRKTPTRFGTQVIVRNLILNDFEKKRINEDLENFTRKLEHYFEEAILFVYVKRRKESYKGLPLVYVRLRLTSDKGVFFAAGEAWGAEYALHATLKKLEREILKEKELLRDRKMIRRFYEDIFSDFG